jgi:hypothetical protein
MLMLRAHRPFVKEMRGDFAVDRLPKSLALACARP